MMTGESLGFWGQPTGIAVKYCMRNPVSKTEMEVFQGMTEEAVLWLVTGTLSSTHSTRKYMSTGVCGSGRQWSERAFLQVVL